MPNGKSKPGETEVYRREGEYDCCMECLAGTKNGKCPGACCPTMRGCCSSFLTLRQGTMAFALFMIFAMIVRLFVTFFGRSYWAHVIGLIVCGILILTSILGLIGAITRNAMLVTIFIRSHVIGAVVIFIVLLIIMVQAPAGFFWLIFLPLDWLMIWWMFVVGKSFIEVLNNGGTGDERNAEDVYVKTISESGEEFNKNDKESKDKGARGDDGKHTRSRSKSSRK